MPGLWKRVAEFAPENFPAAPACYVVTCDPEPGHVGRVLYVGQSANLRARFAQHDLRVPRMPWTYRDVPYPEGFTSTPWGVFRNVVVRYRPAVRYGDWAMVELRMIRRLRPRFNSCALAKRARGEGLRAVRSSRVR